MRIDCNRSMPILKVTVLRLAPVQSKTAAFEMCILLLQSMTAENAAETVAASLRLFKCFPPYRDPKYSIGCMWYPSWYVGKYWPCTIYLSWVHVFLYSTC